MREMNIPVKEIYWSFNQNIIFYTRQIKPDISLNLRVILQVKLYSQLPVLNKTSR